MRAPAKLQNKGAFRLQSVGCLLRMNWNVGLQFCGSSSACMGTDCILSEITSLAHLTEASLCLGVLGLNVDTACMHAISNCQ